MVLGKYFWKYYFKYFLYFFFGILVLVAIDYLQLDIPKTVASIINALTDWAETGTTTFDFDFAVVWILIIGYVVTIGRVGWRLLLLGAARHIEHDIRIRMFNKALELSQNFYSKEKIGNLMTYFINDLDTLRDTYGWGLLQLADALALGGFTLARMLSISLEMTCYIAAPLLLVFVVFFIWGKRMRKFFLRRQNAFSKMSDFVQESFSGVNVVKAFNLESSQEEIFEERSSDLKKHHMGFIRQAVVIDTVLTLVINSIVMIIIWFVAYQVTIKNNTEFTSGNFTLYISYYFSLLWPLMALSQFIDKTNRSSASAKRLSAFLDEQVLVTDSKYAIACDDLEGKIVAKNLSFKYPNSQNLVLENISFTINKGEMVGILGKTGSGKSSLVDLMLRMYNVDKNMLYIGDKDIMDVTVKSVRKLFGYVPQDNFLFSTTITNNIAFSADQTDTDTVVEAAKLAGVHDNVIEFEHSYDTLLGERGVTVSGGQKQRLSIARALYKDPEILILDDSVSAVDTKTEDAIIHNLHNVRKNKTTIFIAHRISTVKRMDKIILLDQGHVVDIGSHDELLSRCKEYAEMVRLQALESIIAGEHHA